MAEISLTCRGCFHWKKAPQDPSNIVRDDSPDRMGFCRQGPPAVVLLMQQNGPRHTMQVPGATYPTVPANWPACDSMETEAEFKARRSLMIAPGRCYVSSEEEQVIPMEHHPAT